MDEIENKPVSMPATDTPDLREQIESLRHLIGSVLILMVMVSGTLTIFLYREMKTASNQLDTFRPQAMNAMTIYQQQQKPLMEEFAKRIQLYGQTHPDLAPVLVRWDPVFTNWGWKISAPTSTTPAGVMPTAPAPAGVAPRSNTLPKK
jgi:hypothetical protein